MTDRRCSKCACIEFEEVRYAAPWAVMPSQRAEIKAKSMSTAVDVTCTNCGHIEEELLE